MTWCVYPTPSIISLHDARLARAHENNRAHIRIGWGQLVETLHGHRLSRSAEIAGEDHRRVRGAPLQQNLSGFVQLQVRCFDPGL